MIVPRRRFLTWLAGGMAGGIALAGAGIGWMTRVEPHRLVVERVSLTLGRLPRPFAGLRIAQLSDLHLGPHIHQADVERAVRSAMSLHPDLILLTGDYVTRWAGYGEALIAPLSRLRASLGVYGTLGNHDHWTDADEITTYLHRAGVTVLRNASCPISRDGGTLWLVGVDDVMEGAEDLPAALASVPEEGCKVALIHEPDFADVAAKSGIDLQLSGHSHGGQVRIPGIGALILPGWGRKYPIGLRRVGETWLYTNRGIGLVSPPVRFNCPPEITLFTLRQAPGHDASA